MNEVPHSSILQNSARLFGRRAGYVVFTVLAMGWISACELLGDDPTPGVGDVETIQYEEHIQAIFNQRCVSCHAGDSPSAGLRLDGWTWLIQGSDFGEAIIPFSSIDSRAMKMLTATSSTPHPQDVGKSKLTDDEIGLLKRWIDEGAVGPLGASPFASSLNLLYITHENSSRITVFDTDAWLVVRTIDLQDYGFSERARANHIAVEPDGSFFYVSVGSIRSSDKQVIAKFNRQHQLLAEYETANPGLIALHPTQNVLYVSRTAESTEPKSFLELRRTDFLPLQIPTNFAGNRALAVRPSGDFLFSSSIDVDQMAVVNLSNLTVAYLDIQGIRQGFNQFAISPTGNRMWGAGIFSNTVSLFDISDPNRIVQRQSLFTDGSPFDLTFTPDGTNLYVTVPTGNRIKVVNTQLEMIDADIRHAGLQEPLGIATSLSGAYMFVSSRNSAGLYPARRLFEGDGTPGTLSVIDTATNKVVKVVEIDSRPGVMGSRIVVPTFTQ